MVIVTGNDRTDAEHHLVVHGKPVKSLDGLQRRFLHPIRQIFLQRLCCNTKSLNLKALCQETRACPLQKGDGSFGVLKLDRVLQLKTCSNGPNAKMFRSNLGTKPGCEGPGKTQAQEACEFTS